MSETLAFVASLGIKPGLHKVRVRQIHLFRHFYGHTNPEDLLEIGWIGLYFREDFILEMFRPHSKKLPDVLKLHGVTAYLCDIKKKTLTATVNTVRVTLLDNWMTQLMSSDDAEQTVCDHCLWVYHFKNYKRRFFFCWFFLLLFASFGPFQQRGSSILSPSFCQSVCHHPRLRWLHSMGCDDIF